MTQSRTLSKSISRQPYGKMRQINEKIISSIYKSILVNSTLPHALRIRHSPEIVKGLTSMSACSLSDVGDVGFGLSRYGLFLVVFREGGSVFKLLRGEWNMIMIRNNASVALQVSKNNLLRKAAEQEQGRPLHLLSSSYPDLPAQVYAPWPNLPLLATPPSPPFGLLRSQIRLCIKHYYESRRKLR